MEIRNTGYNVGSVVIDTVVTLGTKTEIGTAEDFKKVATLADAGGVIRVHVKVGDDQLDGAVFANHVENYIDIGSVTNFGGSPSIIAGTAELDTGKMYLTLTMTPVSTANTTKSTTKSVSK